MMPGWCVSVCVCGIEVQEAARVRALHANEDLLFIVLALADEEHGADDGTKEGEGADDASDDGTCRRAGKDWPLLF